MDAVWKEIKTVTGTILPWVVVVLTASLYITQQEQLVRDRLTTIEQQLAAQTSALHAIDTRLASGVAIPPFRVERGTND